MGHLIFVILQMRMVRIQFVLSVLLLAVLCVRGIYWRRKGRNPYVYGFLWMIPLIALFSGKWMVFESDFFQSREAVCWSVFDEITLFGVIYWGVVGMLCFRYAAGKLKLIRRVRKYRVLMYVQAGKKRCGVRVSDLMHSPYTVGTLHPYIVLPTDYESHYDEEELEMVLQHELTHIRCHHNFFFGMAAIIKCVFWINPAVHYSAKVFRTDMEIFCDGRIAEKRDCTEYGRLILKSVIDPGKSANVLQRVNFFFSKSECQTRIEMLAGYQRAFCLRRGRLFRKIGICVFLSALAVLAGSRICAPGSEGVETIFVADDMELGRMAEISLTEDEYRSVVCREDADSIVIDTKELRDKIKGQGYAAGAAGIWFESYSFGPAPSGVCREEVVCNLYDSSERFLTYHKKITGWKRCVKYL